jgi:hypothetical protein
MTQQSKMVDIDAVFSICLQQTTELSPDDHSLQERAMSVPIHILFMSTMTLRFDELDFCAHSVLYKLPVFNQVYQ